MDEVSIHIPLHQTRSVLGCAVARERQVGHAEIYEDYGRNMEIIGKEIEA